MPPRSLMSSLAFAALAATAVARCSTASASPGSVRLPVGRQPGMGRQQTDRLVRPEIYGRADHRQLRRPAPVPHHQGRVRPSAIRSPCRASRAAGRARPRVTDKRINPSWRPTPEMLRENPKLPIWVPGGHRMNPLGVRAMYLGSSTYRIHGTDAPWTIGQAVSKGCIRMFNEDVLDLYPRVPVGTKVTVTWQRFYTQAVASSDEPAPSSRRRLCGAPAYKSAAAQHPPAHAGGRRRDGRRTAHGWRRHAAVDPTADEADARRRRREADRDEAGEEGRGAQEARSDAGHRRTPWRLPRRPPLLPPRLPRLRAPPPKPPRRPPRTPRRRRRRSLAEPGQERGALRRARTRIGLQRAAASRCPFALRAPLGRRREARLQAGGEIAHQREIELRPGLEAHALRDRACRRAHPCPR